MHISLTLGAILFSLVHQLYCDEKIDSRQKHAEVIVPSAPHNLTVKKITSSEVHLTWAKPYGVHIHSDTPHHQARTADEHPAKPDVLDIKAGDILANKDSALVGVLRDTPRHHTGFASRLTKNELTEDEKFAISDKNYAPDEEEVPIYDPWRSDRERYFRRRKRRRDAQTTTTDVAPTTIDQKVTTLLPKSDLDYMGVKKDDATVVTAEDSAKSANEASDVEMTTEYEGQFINYVLFYEEGLPGGVADSWQGGFAENPPQRPAKVKEIVLAHQDGRDGLKGVKYTLRGLKPYSHYRIWVRAYYTDPSSLPSVPSVASLSPPSPRLVVLTDVPPPSPPLLRNLSCDQPPGTLLLAWSRPERYARTLDAYAVTLRRVGGAAQRIQLDTEEDHIETAISLPVDIVNNISLYEVTLQAFTKSIVDPKVLINGTETEPYQVTMTLDCVASPLVSGGQGAGLGAPAGDEMMSRPELGYMIALLALGVATLLVLLSLYRWGCATAFKKCYPMSYLFLEEGGGGEGCGEGGPPNKPEAQASQGKKAVSSPAHAVVFWGAVDGAAGADSGSAEQLWDALHPPVPADRFLAHTAALHQDGDIGFSKEYELIQSKSAILGHSSHHSQHPENRHKNRYLNITAYDHSRVCLLPSSSCSCDPGKDHRRSCTSKPVAQSGDSSPHCDYVNANFIDGIVAEIDAELAKFIIEQNERRKLAQKKKQDAEATKLEIEMRQANDSKVSQPLLPLNVEGGSFESKIPHGFNTVDPRISLGPFESKIANVNKDKMSLDLNGERKVTSPGLEILPNTCRLSINLDKKEEKEKVENDTKSDTKSVKEAKGKKRSTSADTRDIVIDKKNGSRGHSKNSSVVVNNDSSPLNGVPKIEGAFLNIEFSGIVDSERELQKAREAERLEEANRLAKEAAEETLDDLDDLYVHIGGESYRVKSSWLLDRRRYIGTQGPTPGTLPAFWRMVWDHRVAVLVMITNLVERGRRKCDMYWPKEGTETYGAIQVVMLKEDVMATYTVRTFQIKNTKVGLSRPVLQYHYTVWPDHGTPEHPLAVLRFREAARRAAPPQAGAILVHCSAGVGRTGTYIVLDAMLNHLKLTGSLNVFGFLCHVRTQRNFLVQTEEQYVFIHDALLEAIQSGDTEVPAEHAKEYLKRLLEPFPEGHVLDGGSLNNKCGLYGAPLSDKKEPIRNVDLGSVMANGAGRLRNVSTGESDFAMWENENGARFKDERTLDECRNELVSVSLQNSMFNERNRKDIISECNGNRHIDANVVRKVFEEDNGNFNDRDSMNEKNSANGDTVINCDDSGKYITLDMEDDSAKKMTTSDISPELIIDEMDQKMIDFGDGPLTSVLTKNLLVKNDKINNLDAKGDNVSMNSHSTSYEKLNGTCTKTSEESKASSMSNEDVDLLSNENNGSGKMDEVNGTTAFGNDNSNTVTSSISSDTNNLNNVANFRDRPNFSPSLGTGNQDGPEVYRRERNMRPKNEDNYELLGTGSRIGALGGNADSCFAGGHRFSCQRRDTTGRKPRNLLEHQFKLVTSFEPSKYHTVSACKLVNQVKNRRGAVLPVESGRVHLIPKPGVEGSDYINATWLQGHRSLREYVVTQHPVAQTVEDLYRLLWDHSCQILVQLTDTDDQECQSFWPTKENPEINAYTYCIRFVSQEKHFARRKPPGADSQPSPQKSEGEGKQPSPIQSPSSAGLIKGFPLKLSKNSQRSSPVSPNEDTPKSPITTEMSPNPCSVKSGVTMDDKHDTSYYRRQSSADNQDEERLIPKSDEPPSLECAEETDELKKLNSEPKTEGYAFDRSELRIEAISSNDCSEASGDKTSPSKPLANGDPFSPKDDNSKKSQTKSPSKISLKSLRISSPVLKSPTKFKFDFGARISINSKLDHDQGRKSPTPSPVRVETPAFERRFEMVPLNQLTPEDVGKDCVITTTHLSMNSIQDDYELKVRLVECPKWLADLDYDENSDTDEESDNDEYELETKALDYVIEQRLRAYKGVFGLPEYVTRCQDDMKNSPVVVVDKLGGARATALCTLSSALRRNSRDVYSLAKLHHGRRPGVWRRPADIRALYEAIASYQNPDTQ